MLCLIWLAEGDGRFANTEEEKYVSFRVWVCSPMRNAYDQLQEEGSEAEPYVSDIGSE